MFKPKLIDIFDEKNKNGKIYYRNAIRWDDQKRKVKISDPNSTAINRRISSIETAANELLIDYKEGKKGVNPKDVVNAIKELNKA